MGLLSSIKPKAGKSKSESGFRATINLDVRAKGYNQEQALGRPEPEYYWVHDVESDSKFTIKYFSSPHDWLPNSFVLAPSLGVDQTLISTTYPFDMGRTIEMQILPGNDVPGDHIKAEAHSSTVGVWVFHTRWGTFEWRDGSREEKSAASDNSLLVMERVDGGTRVAQLFRDDKCRTRNMCDSSFGNGGRLMLDLRKWEAVDEEDAAKIEVFVVASCILMLKEEARRFIDNTRSLAKRPPISL